MAHLRKKDNVMADMLSRVWFEGAVEREEEEVLEDYFTSENIFRVCEICELREEE